MKRSHFFPIIVTVMFCLISEAWSQNVSSGFCWVNHETSSGYSIASGIDSDGLSYYVAGEFRGIATFGGDAGEEFTSTDGSADGFLAKYNSDGTLVWVVPAGVGPGDVIPKDVSVESGNVYVTGEYRETTTFGDGPNAVELGNQGARDVFVARFDTDGNFNTAVRAGGSGSDRAFGILGTTVTGFFEETATFGSQEFTAQGEDIFIVTYTTDLSAVVWIRQIGGTGDDRGYDLAEDGDLFVTGVFSETTIFGENETNEASKTSRGDKDIFVASFNPNNGNLNWVRRAGGGSEDRGDKVAAARSGNDDEFLAVTGWFVGSADFEGGPSVQDNGNGDVYLARYDYDGNLINVNTAGGPAFDKGTGLAIINPGSDDAGPQFVNAIVVGEFQSDSIVFEQGQYNETVLDNNGQTDILIAKYNHEGQFRWAKQIGGAGVDEVRDVELANFEFFGGPNNETVPLQNSFIVGSFQESVTFGLTPQQTFESEAESDIFVARLSDFLRPSNLGLGDNSGTPLAKTPYIKVNWDSPINEAAPSLSSPDPQLIGSACTFADGTEGTRYRITADFEDLGQSDVDASPPVIVAPVSSRFGAQVELDAGSSSANSSSSGTVSFEVCLRFGEEPGVFVSFAIQDNPGNVSNFLSVEIANPDFSGGLSRIGSHFQPPAKSRAIPLDVEDNCNASINLIGYNVYRQLNQTSPPGPLELLATVSPDQTTYIDQTTDPSTSYIYRVTALYEEGESDHIGDGGSSGSPGSETVFTRITDNPVIDGGGFSGASVWGDFDNDRRLDLFVPTFNVSRNLLFHNIDSDRFERVETGDIFNDVVPSNSASWGDFNRDGWLDLFVANGSTFNRLANFLYRNDNGVLTRVTTGEIVTLQEASNAGVWGDYNNDGWLDLFVANLGVNSLFRNEGGTFTRVTTGPIATDFALSYSASWVDYDNDRDIDLFVANNGTNAFYQNQGEAGGYAFVKLTGAELGDWINDDEFSMGASWADFDNDLDMDLFIANRLTRNVLLQNTGGGRLEKVPASEVVIDEGRSFGSGWADFDNDGDLDLYVTNLGDIAELTGGPPTGIQQSNFFYLNDGSGNLAKQGDPRGNFVFDAQASNGSSWADYNEDGFLDLFVANGVQTGDNALYLNRKRRIDNTSLNNDNNFVSIVCEGTLSNTSALGAKVKVKAQINGAAVWQVSEISGQTGGGWGGQNSLAVEFGLADATRIDSLIIEWPSGTTFDTTNVDVPGFLKFREKQVNQPPTAGDDNQTTDEGAAVDIVVVSNDMDPDGDDLTIVDVTNGDIGTTTIKNDSTITYTPTGDLNGSDTFTYVVSDGNANTDTATVFVTVTPVNDPPGSFVRLAPADNSTLSDVAEFVWSQSVDVDGDNVTYTLTLIIGGFSQPFTLSDTSTTIDFRDFSLAQAEHTIGWTVTAADDEESVEAANGQGTFSVVITDVMPGDQNQIPQEFSLHQNYPNPFNPTTVIRFDLSENSRVRLEIYNALGQVTRTLLLEDRPAGSYVLSWDARDDVGKQVPSGLYFYRVEAIGATQTFTDTKKMLLLR